ncbi:FecR family protein [Chitinophaga solisilvae]|uniref:FecR family protein n=1 Tax=Chitinophaga solisilvae TaxID=1233460 RepID=UPI0013712B74|nr:FecR domain-containing protein [Chitinophaga solisilvae]
MDFRDYQAIDFACDESFQRYCVEDNDADISFWEGWIQQHPGKAAETAEARRLVELLTARQGGRLEQLLHLKSGLDHYDLLQALTAEPVAGLSTPEPLTLPSPAPRFGPILRYAAAAALLLAVTTGILLTRSSRQPQQQMAAAISAGNEPRKTVVLPDGSSIILRQHSEVALAPGFNTTNRELTLTGEAFFDVAPGARHPFIVHTTLADITVLGTVFNINACTEMSGIEASLFKGKVEVAWKNNRQKKILLLPNQKIVINGNGQTTAGTDYKVIPLDADPVNHKAKEINWVRNRLEIENEPLADIAARLQQWYGIRIAFADEEVKQYRYSGTFESETIIKALDALQLSYPFSFRMAGDSIIISR